jgi:hypothetical protein
MMHKTTEETMTPDLAAYLRTYLPERKDPPPRVLRPEEISQPSWTPRFPGDEPDF